MFCSLVKEALVWNPLLSQTGKSRSLPDHFHVAASGYLKTFWPGTFGGVGEGGDERGGAWEVKDKMLQRVVSL